MLITSLDQLSEFVKISKSRNFEVYSPFIRDAEQKYLEPYFGESLLSHIAEKKEDELYSLLCRSLGPFSLALATDELSINFGETGHTVTRTDTLAPASDEKISKAVESLLARGWANLDYALRYILEHESLYPLWSKSFFAKRLSSFFFRSAKDFQDNGLVDIDYSPLTFHRLLPLIQRVESTEAKMLLTISAKKDYVALDDYPAGLVSLMQGYVASRVASIHTSQISRIQRSKARVNVDFKPLMRPLFESLEEDNNFYAEQAEKYKQSIFEELVSLGHISIESRAMKWNDKDKKIFVANSK